MKFYKIPVGPSTWMLGALFVGSAVDAVIKAIADGETSVAALATAATSAIVLAVTRAFQTWVASRDPLIEPVSDSQ